MSSVVPSEFDSISTGASSGPSTWTLIGQPSALMTGMGSPLWAGCLRALAGAQLQRPDDAVDERLRRALIVHGLEQTAQIADAQMRLHPFIFAQHLLQFGLGGDGLAAGLLDDLARLLPAELAGEREGHRFGHDQAARLAEVDAHALAVDLEALEIG